MYQYDKLVQLYSEKVDSEIYSKLHEVFKKNRDAKLKTVTMNAVDYSQYPNNLYKMKIEKGISNKELCKLTHNAIQPASISLICTRKDSA